MTCKYCEFFKKGHFENSINGPLIKLNEEKKYGMCLHTKVRSDYVDSWLSRSNYDNEHNDDISANCDEERGELRIGENFGCIHFKAK